LWKRRYSRDWCFSDYIEFAASQLFLLLFLVFYTPGSIGSRGLKTKVKNKAGIAIGPVDPQKMSRAKALN